MITNMNKEMESSALLLSPTCQNAKLTNYNFQGKTKNGCEVASMIIVTNKNALLTDYDCKSRMKNRHGIISMIIVTNMPKCTTHYLLPPKQHKECK